MQHRQIRTPPKLDPREQDARRLFDALMSSPVRRDIKIGRATHLIHLETMRQALYRESIAFPAAGDDAGLNIDSHHT